ncbi:CDP-alcohol phosphatidyltransferase [Listeria newyorkensis]|uniref:CDP-alcohol phosphatidyltransferase n=1 Tax=Listeria newyorkensis TaxID=1497681 RepID=A0ABX4XPI6_9LIST|nr:MULTISPECIES: CDP-alcohol phosphatidyltransferase family protein [Listeria]KGL39553.1 CDP-alcohol phosphatidyltransferase [Listeriaceae bacterium FSL A5-0209]KGL44176.1 CDP-alcohol phosphatidyltransferase [Listeria newyorkensis]KMT61548.1 CDP-alcohol phosphatidyltransferase [Listeria newyorkensis]PNP93102.1 CDP-alcohol phosphatidyltransferase [Listeria newyorkensis]RQW67099.1 CDP-alcohol phosphatidyltransferase family protein [Listeria sp. SHR_NRA_18]
MLDTKARPYVKPILEKTADFFLKIGFSANQVTILAFVVGVVAAILVGFGWMWTGILVLWFSGFLDAVDGTMARKTKQSGFGTVMDVTFDRVVEAGIIIALAARFPEQQFILLLLMASILFGITAFLTIGNVVQNKGVKSFHYATGLAERTEGFILLSLMVLTAPIFLFWTTLLFFIIEIISTIQRLMEAHRQLDKEE